MSISVRGITKRFDDFVALDDVSIEVAAGSLTALLGPSGSGKSTLLRIIAGLETADTGSVLIDDADVTGQRPQERGVGFVFQHYAAFKHMTVYDNVAFGLEDPEAPEGGDRRAREPAPEARPARGPRQALPVAALGRATPADGPRAGARDRSGRAPARRAVRRARRTRASRATRMAAPPPRRDSHDDGDRHARPGGGDGGRRRGSRDEPGTDRAGRSSPRRLRAPRERVRDDVRRPGPPDRGRLRPTARPRGDARAERLDARGHDRAYRALRVRRPARPRRRGRRAALRRRRAATTWSCSSSRSARSCTSKPRARRRSPDRPATPACSNFLTPDGHVIALQVNPASSG